VQKSMPVHEHGGRFDVAKSRDSPSGFLVELLGFFWPEADISLVDGEHEYLIRLQQVRALKRLSPVSLTPSRLPPILANRSPAT
jgi:hypothetical protein